MRTRTRLLAFPLIVGLAAAAPLPATADAPGADAAVEWMYSKTLDSGLIESFPGWGDVGLTFDSILAAAATDAPREMIDKWVAGTEADFYDKYVWDEGDGLRWTPGVVGKAVVALDAVGVSTTDFAGTNPQDLAVKSLTLGAEPGWVGAPDDPTGSNAFAQALVMMAVARTGDLPAEPVEFVASKQCDDGGFPMFFQTGKSCAEAGSSSDPDGTALITMALLAAKADGVAAADAPLQKATSWLVSMQRDNGSYFGAVPWTAVENTNSTGLISGVLAGINAGVAADAATWVSSLQVPEGAIAYDATGFEAGLTSTNVSQYVRSTPQAVLALAGASYHNVQWSDPSATPSEPVEEPSPEPTPDSTEPTDDATEPAGGPSTPAPSSTEDAVAEQAPRPGLPKTGH